MSKMEERYKGKQQQQYIYSKSKNPLNERFKQDLKNRICHKHFDFMNFLCLLHIKRF